MDKIKLNSMIEEMERKLEETKISQKNVSNPAQDAINVVVPMLQDQLVIMRGIVDRIT